MNIYTCAYIYSRERKREDTGVQIASIQKICIIYNIIKNYAEDETSGGERETESDRLTERREKERELNIYL